ncbi:MAG: AtpZ/AtpI family protein [Pseudobdellovibrionaceae bacterium]
MKKYIIFASIGFELVGLIIGCFYLGQYLDQKYNSRGLIFVGLTFLALIGWLWRVIWLLRRMQKSEDSEDIETKKFENKK